MSTGTLTAAPVPASAAPAPRTRRRVVLLAALLVLALAAFFGVRAVMAHAADVRSGTEAVTAEEFGARTGAKITLIGVTAGGPDDETARATAGALVLSSAQAAWDNRATVEDLPLFSAFWERDAQVPTAGTQDAQFVEGAVNSSEIPERDLSVQLAGWMLMEAAHTVAGDRD